MQIEIDYGNVCFSVSKQTIDLYCEINIWKIYCLFVISVRYVDFFYVFVINVLYIIDTTTFCNAKLSSKQEC